MAEKDILGKIRNLFCYYVVKIHSTNTEHKQYKVFDIMAQQHLYGFLSSLKIKWHQSTVALV